MISFEWKIKGFKVKLPIIIKKLMKQENLIKNYLTVTVKIKKKQKN